MNMKNETHKCVPRNSQINLSAKSLSDEMDFKNLVFMRAASKFA